MRRAFELATDRWDRIQPSSVWSATALVVVAWGLMAFNRLGGLAFVAPRALARLTLVGVWGWLGLSVATWATVSLVGWARQGRRWPRSTLRTTLAVVGLAHVPIVALAVVVLIAAGALQLLGPGLLVSVLTFAVLVPFALVTGVCHVFGLGAGRATLAIAPMYVAWLFLVARPALGQVQHLL